MGEKMYVAVRLDGKVYFIPEEEFKENEIKKKHKEVIVYGIIPEEKKKDAVIHKYKGKELLYISGHEATDRFFRAVNKGVPDLLLIQRPIILRHDAIVEFVREYIDAFGNTKETMDSLLSFFNNNTVRKTIAELIESGLSNEEIKAKLGELLANILVS